ncbi:MAG: chaperone NapD [Bryobacterales bacterium]|nr:chaperone NapD [Bryobacterales bacterium]
MAIQSYLVYAKPGCREAVAERLREFPHSDISPAQQHDVVILVTETSGKSGTELLETHLASIPGVDGYALVAGYSDELIAAEEN